MGAIRVLMNMSKEWMTQKERISLYNEIWNEPVSKVALRYGVSDTTIRKRCIYYGIPLPYRGYWEKLKAGQNVKKIELPEVEGDLRRRITNYFINFISDINQISDEDLELDDDLSILSDITKTQIKQKCKEIKISNTLHKPHNLINNLKSLKAFSIKELSSHNVQRIYLLMDSIIKMVEQMEAFAFTKTHEGRPIFKFMLLHADIEFDFLQEKRKSNGKKTGKEESLKLLVNIGSWYISSTNICVEYNEDNNSNLESQVCQIVYDMFVNAVKINCKIEILKRTQERKWEEERRQRELKELRKVEMEKIAKLEEFISDWERAEKIRSFVAKLEDIIEKESNEKLKSELAKLAIWSKEKADWLDPLKGAEIDYLRFLKYLENNDS